MEAEAFRKIHPSLFVRKFLEQGLRPDGRTLLKARKLTVSHGNVSSADGSALVKLGNTTVVAGAKAEVGVPDDASPAAGKLEISVELTPLSASRFRPGKQSDESMCVEEYVRQVLSSAGVLDPLQLCISERKAVWVLYVDIYCVDNDGGALDASLAAAVAALSNTTLPRVALSETGEVIKEAGGARMPLTVAHYPASVSFAMVEGHVVADPTAEEEALATGAVTVCHDELGRLCTVYKAGGAPFKQDVLQSVIGTASTITLAPRFQKSLRGR
eukprot:tig00020912_g15825.t1